MPSTTRYVAFLRGVNVGTINIKMVDLKQTFTALGFESVRTVLASGNVVFESDRRDRVVLKSDIESALRAAFGYEAWIVLLDTATVEQIIADYPFDPEHDGWHPYVVLGSDGTVLDDLLASDTPLDPDVEQVARGVDVVYWEVVRAMTLRSTFGKRTARKRYKAATTTRNLRTLVKVVT